MALQQRMKRQLFCFASQVRTYSAPADRSIPAAKQKYVPTEGTYPKGFLAGSAHAGVKASNIKHDDIALVVSETPCHAAAVFTRNKFSAAPLGISKRTLYKWKDDVRGVVVNSGCANAITGERGLKNAVDMGLAADRCFGKTSPIDAESDTNGEDPIPHTLVMSTGVIGQQLPIDKVKAAIPKAHKALGSEHEHWMSAAQAICTTDTFPKLISRSFRLPSHPDTEYHMTGMTKGAGMIHPNMGTLLGIICTDVKCDHASLRSALKKATSLSFNCISIDGDTSTNDTVAVLANGAAAPAESEPLKFERGTTWSADAKAFFNVFSEFMKDLAKLVVRDGEGATKFVTIKVKSDVSIATAVRAAQSIATSNLVKTALYGKDANWGRILCAIGYAPGIMGNQNANIPAEGQKASDGKWIETNQVNLKGTSVAFVPADGSSQLDLLVNGEPQEVDEVRAKEILEMEDLEISVHLNSNTAFTKVEGSNESKTRGRARKFECEYWTCDFSHEYVTINGDYRT